MRVVPRAAIASASEGQARFRYAQRLHRPDEFSAVMAARHVLRGAVFDLHYRLTTRGHQTSRLGLIISKRLARAASMRNAVKRQCREAFRLVAIDIPPCDLVLRLTQPVKGSNARDRVQKKLWRMDLVSLLKRLPMLPR